MTDECPRGGSDAARDDVVRLVGRGDGRLLHAVPGEGVGEQPGAWSGVQADRLGLSGEVGADALRLLLEGRDPVTGTPLGWTLSDRFRADGSVVRAVAGFGATFSAPKSLRVLWAWPT